MNERNLKLSIVLVIFVAFLSLLVTILSGLFKIFIIAILILVVVAFLMDFISKKFSNSRFWKSVNKVLEWIKEFLKEIIPFI